MLETNRKDPLLYPSPFFFAHIGAHVGGPHRVNYIDHLSLDGGANKSLIRCGW